MPLPRLLLSDKDVAEMFSCSRRTVWNRVKAGDLPSPIVWGGATRWRMQDLVSFVDSLGGSTGGSAPPAE